MRYLREKKINIAQAFMILLTHQYVKVDMRDGDLKTENLIGSFQGQAIFIIQFPSLNIFFNTRQIDHTLDEAIYNTL